ncbi:hypothetical protein EVAR_25916_1 [Eumeta japonica]|uniref:Uncharacterized protein n=1 Tax=Eumeta variegata TaxID=151549 RepID=A0A4C1W2W8_EUMVA|nr:hypothetical protein EVAR_25916_1 [Eumeta japonica]
MQRNNERSCGPNLKHEPISFTEHRLLNSAKRAHRDKLAVSPSDTSNENILHFGAPAADVPRPPTATRGAAGRTTDI